MIRFTFLLISVVFSLLASIAYSQEVPDDLLSGPKLESEEVTQKDMTDRRLQETGKAKLNDRTLVSLWIKAMESINLDARQKTIFREAIGEYQIAQEDFRKTHKDELDKIRAENRTAQLEGRGAAADSTRKRMLELAQMSPDVSIYQERVWQTLTDEQQTAFKNKYQSLIEEQSQIQAERKNTNNPMMNPKEGVGFAPGDSKFRDKTIAPENDPKERRWDALDSAALKRIRFLKKLQNLQES